MLTPVFCDWVLQRFITIYLLNNLKPVGSHFHYCPFLFVVIIGGSFMRINFEVIVLLINYLQIRLCYLKFNSSVFFHSMPRLYLLYSYYVLILTTLLVPKDFDLQLSKSLVMILFTTTIQFIAFLTSSSFPIKHLNMYY